MCGVLLQNSLVGQYFQLVLAVAQSCTLVAVCATNVSRRRFPNVGRQRALSYGESTAKDRNYRNHMRMHECGGWGDWKFRYELLLSPPVSTVLCASFVCFVCHCALSSSLAWRGRLSLFSFQRSKREYRAPPSAYRGGTCSSLSDRPLLRWARTVGLVIDISLVFHFFFVYSELTVMSVRSALHVRSWV